MFSRAVFLFTLSFTALVVASPDSWRLDDYRQAYPAQKVLDESFSALVQNPAIPLSVEQKKPVFVYMITPSQQFSDYWWRNSLAFSERLDELGIKHVIKHHDIKVKIHKIQKQKLIERALLESPDFLILTLDVATDADFIHKIIKHKKTRIIIQNVTNPFKYWGENQPLLYVGFDHEMGSKMLANYFMETFSGTAKYAVNDYYPGFISEKRGRSFITAVDKGSNFEMISRLYTDATRGTARSNAINLASQHPDLNFIYASSTDIAIGTSKALQGIERRDIKVNGWGGGMMELQALAKEELDVTVMRMNDDNGIAMAEAIKLVLENKESSVPVVHSGEFKLVTSKTKPLEVEKLIRHAFRYSDRHVMHK